MTCTNSAHGYNWIQCVVDKAAGLTVRITLWSGLPSWHRVFALLIARVLDKAADATTPFWTALFLVLWSSSAAHAQSTTGGASPKPLDIVVNPIFRYDDNVTRAPSGPDKLSDQFYELSASKRFEIPVDAHTLVVVNAIVDGELAQRFHGLGRIAGEIQGELQYRGSGKFGAPTFALFGHALAENYGSGLRSGYRYSAGVSVLQPVTDRITLFGQFAHNWRYARSAVFNTRDNAVLLNVDYAISPRGTVYLSGEYRDGRVVSTGQETLQIVDIAQLFVPDDVFTSPQMVDYRFDARTVIATLGYNLPVGATSSLDFSWKRIQTRSTEHASFPGGGALEYVANQFAIAYLVRF
jgi:hypothetical protein